MIRKLFYVIISICCVTSGAAAESVWVQVKVTRIRSAPEHFASGVASVKYGDALTYLGEDAGWVKVTIPSGGTGYLPLASVSPQKIVFSSRGSTNTKAEASDVVLAGKGFSPEVEGKYKQAGNAGRFDLVDKVEKVPQISFAELKTFAQSGGLKG